MSQPHPSIPAQARSEQTRLPSSDQIGPGEDGLDKAPGPTAERDGPSGLRNDAVSTAVVVPAGRQQSGRHREHVFPARPRRVAPSFTVEEYAALVAAATRAGLTPTGFCARAALGLAGVGADTAQPSATGVCTHAHEVVAARLAGDERVEALAAVQAELAGLRTAVVRVGTNLNQAVAALQRPGRYRCGCNMWSRSAAGH